MGNKIGIFIDWKDFDRRNDIISKYLGYEMIFIHKEIKSKFLKKIRHIIYFFMTYNILKKKRCDIVIFTNNIFIHGISAYFFSKVFNFRLVLDTHSDPFNSQFKNITYPSLIHKYLARRVTLSLVHTPGNKMILEKWGAKVLLFPDLVDEEMTKMQISNQIDSVNSQIYIVFVCTYAKDEPYKQAFEAFNKFRNYKFFVTGKITDKKNISKYPNVIQTGYLRNDDYVKLLKNSLFIITLTERENTMQCAGNEALSLGKPIILSNKSFLKEYFHKGCVYTDNTVDSIVKSIDKMIINFSQYQNEILSLREEKIKYREYLISEYLRIINNDNNN